MKKNRSDCDAPRWDGPPVTVLWTQSLVWGLLCIDTLSRLGIPFQLLSASEVCQGGLDGSSILIVPGGWAAHRVRALGETGKRKIAGFIDDGGSYIGFCGGAGLALSSPPALYLTPIRRAPLSQRLPSASGEIYVCGLPSHPAWENIPSRIPVSVWWPSQFQLDPEPARFPTPRKVVCLASYEAPGDGFQVADLRVSDVDEGAGWDELEKLYGINLDPRRIRGHPAIIEVERGRGRLVLSYAHLETPDEKWGNRLFHNILKYLNDVSVISTSCGESRSLISPPMEEQRTLHLSSHSRASGISKARQAAADLIAFGEAYLLWNWRKPWLLNWRRGIRGLEYGSLYVTLCHMADLEKKLEAEPSGYGRAVFDANWSMRAEELEERTLEFCALAKRLLFEEKIAAGKATFSKLGKVNKRVDSLRGSLFGNKMSYGGLCGALFDLIDGMLLELIRKRIPWTGLTGFTGLNAL